MGPLLRSILMHSKIRGSGVLCARKARGNKEGGPWRAARDARIEASGPECAVTWPIRHLRRPPIADNFPSGARCDLSRTAGINGDMRTAHCAGIWVSDHRAHLSSNGVPNGLRAIPEAVGWRRTRICSDILEGESGGTEC